MSPSDASEQNDPFDLARFVDAQQYEFEDALSELRRGRKESHWIWFIFPQLDGLGSSPTAARYAIKTHDEARAYLAHPLLGPSLLQCCRALLSLRSGSASDIMGYPDDLKLRSSMTLFSLVAGEQREFEEVLKKFYGGKRMNALSRWLVGLDFLVLGAKWWWRNNACLARHPATYISVVTLLRGKRLVYPGGGSYLDRRTVKRLEHH